MTPTVSDNQAVLLAPDLLRQAEQRAAQMNVSRDQLVEIALTNYLALSLLPDDADAEDAHYLRAIRSKQARALARSENNE